MGIGHQKRSGSAGQSMRGEAPSSRGMGLAGQLGPALGQLGKIDNQHGQYQHQHDHRDVLVEPGDRVVQRARFFGAAVLGQHSVKILVLRNLHFAGRWLVHLDVILVGHGAISI